MELTPRQLNVYEYILDHHQQHGMAPTVRETCEYLGLKGPAGVHRILNILIDKGFIESISGKKRSWRPVVPIDYDKTIPIAGSITAGNPMGMYDHAEDYLPIDPILYGHSDCFALRVAGDSMTDAHIADGDLAIIVPADDAENGSIVAVLVDDLITEATLKIFRRKKNMIELHSANRRYPPIIFKGKDRKKVRVVGKYAGLIRLK